MPTTRRPGRSSARVSSACRSRGSLKSGPAPPRPGRSCPRGARGSPAAFSTCDSHATNLWACPPCSRFATSLTPSTGGSRRGRRWPACPSRTTCSPSCVVRSSGRHGRSCSSGWPGGRRSRRARPAVIVLDASALLELLLRTPAGVAVARWIAPARETLHAPHLIDLEVAQVLRRYTASRQVSEERAAEALDDLAALDLARYPHDVLLPRVWELRQNVTAYDAAYLTLAEMLPATLLTRDRGLARVPGVKARVEVL